VTQIEPPIDPSRRPFALLSPQAEVIVAPKVRQPTPAEGEGAFDLTGPQNSVASTTKSKKVKRRATDPSFLLRTICLPHSLFEETIDEQQLCVYINPYLKASSVVSGGLTRISILPSPSKPPPQEKRDENTNPETEFTIAKQLVVKVQAWDDAPDDHVAISPLLAKTLGITGLGDIARYTLCVPC
jgi:peroxin-1